MIAAKCADDERSSAAGACNYGSSRAGEAGLCGWGAMDEKKTRVSTPLIDRILDAERLLRPHVRETLV